MVYLQYMVTCSTMGDGFQVHANDTTAPKGARENTDEARQERSKQDRMRGRSKIGKDEAKQGRKQRGTKHLADIVEVSVGCRLLGKELLVSVEHDMQVELLLQQHEAVVTEALDWAHGCNLAHPAPPL